MQDRPKLGEILVRAGVIDAIQLKSALGEQQRWGNRLGITLVNMNLLDEATLVRTLAAQLELPMARLAGKQITAEILELVPPEAADKHRCLPLFVKEEGGLQSLHLGMEDPSNLEALDELAFQLGMKIRPVLVAPSELSEAIDRYYGPSAQFQNADWGEGDGDTASPEFVDVPDDPEPSFASADPAPPPAPEPAAPSDGVQHSAVLRAIAQLLVEKGLLSREELIERVRSCKGGDGEL